MHPPTDRYPRRAARVAVPAVLALVVVCAVCVASAPSGASAALGAEDDGEVLVAESARVGDLPVSVGQREPSARQRWSRSGPAVPLMAVMSLCLLAAGAAMLWLRCRQHDVPAADALAAARRDGRDPVATGRDGWVGAGEGSGRRVVRAGRGSGRRVVRAGAGHDVP